MIFDIFMVVAACTVFAIGCEAWTAMLLNVEKLKVKEIAKGLRELTVILETEMEKELIKKNDKRKRK